MSEHTERDGLDAFLREALLRANDPQVMDLPTPEALETEPGFSETFEARMDRFLQNPFPAPRRSWRRALRTAACFVLVLSTAFGAAMLHPSARAWMSNILTQWHPTNQEFRFHAPAQGDDASPGWWLPDQVPEGYTEIERSSDFDVFYAITYSDGADRLIRLSYSPAGGTAIAIDNEHGTPELTTVWGAEAHLMRANVEGWPSQLIWTSPDGTVAFHLSGEIPAEDLVALAESITKQS